MFLVTGATGTAGARVVQALLARGQEVRAFTRDPVRARRRLGDGVELAVGDFAEPGSVAAALEGVRGVVLSCADDPRRVGWETAAIDAAAAAGVRRIVRLSALGAEPASPVAFWDWHARVDAHLRAAPVPSVILRSAYYMTNLAVRDRLLVAPAGDAAVAMVDPHDVGAAAAAALLDPEHEGRIYTVTGPAAITFAEAAATLSAATGEEIRYVDVPDAAAHQAMTAAGLPAAVADQLVAIHRQLRAGVAADPTTAVTTLTGRPPHPFLVFAREQVTSTMAGARA